jgi:starvation-inducible DNA-binding protein
MVKLQPPTSSPSIDDILSQSFDKLSKSDSKKKDSSLPGPKKEIADHLNKIAASIDALCVKTRGFTYNIVSENFYEYHTFLNMTIAYLKDASYHVSERVRALQGFANYSLKTIMDMSEIKDEGSVITDYDQMTRILLKDYETLSDLARDGFQMATKVVDAGTIALTTGLACKFEHYAWEIRTMVEADEAEGS